MADTELVWWECLILSNNRRDIRARFQCSADDVALHIDFMMSVPGVVGVSYENFKDTGNGYRLLNEYELEQWTKGRN